VAFILAEKSLENEVSRERIVSSSLKKEIIVFIALTLGLTFLLNLVMWVNYDLIVENIELFSLALQFQMLIPAFSAIILNLFVFKTKTYSRKAIILFYYFLVLTALYTLIFAVRLVIPIELASIQLNSIENFGPIILIGLLSLITTFLTFGWIGLIFVWNFKSDSRKELRGAKLSFGKPVYYLLFGLFFFGYFLLSTILNWGFNLGSPPSEQVELGSLILAFAAIIFGPILAFPQYFGEEYGWRIFLQDRFAQQYGRFKGVLLVGLVWGLWHAPLIAAGVNYPGYPILGILLFSISSILISIPLGLAVFKSKSVWLAVFLHGIINGSANVLALYVYNPNDPVYSFGIGIYGLLVLGAMTFFFLKSKEWRKK
jgi:membrane protease YdiL (CAAX protease family)